MFCKTNPNETMFTLTIRALVLGYKKNSTKWCERRAKVVLNRTVFDSD